MEFRKYGIDFRLVELGGDIEILRIFRNLPHVRSEMFFKNKISKESHDKWFQSFDKKSNFYFIYSVGSNDIGVVNLKNINFNHCIGEAGIFVANKIYLGSHLNIGALLFLYDYAFDILELNKLQAHIMPTNLKAIKMNISLGFKLVDVDHHRYVLIKSDYVNIKRRFERLFNHAPA